MNHLFFAIRRCGAAGAFALMAGSAPAAPAYVQREALDGVVAVVNDEVILASELGEEVSVSLYRLGPSSPEAKDLSAYTARVLESMIEARLLLQDADARNIVVGKEDVKTYVDAELERIKAAYETPEEFRAALAESGMTEKDLVAQLRRQLRDQFKINRLVDEVLSPRVGRLDEGELRSYFNAHRDEFAVPATATLREIVITTQPGEGTVQALEAKLAKLKAEVVKGADFAAAAKALAAAEGGEAGAGFEFAPGEAVPELEEIALTLRPGEFSPITRKGGSLWMVKLVSAAGEYRKVQYIRLPIRPGAADEYAARVKAEEAYAALIKGVPFEEVAVRYSVSDTAPKGGWVGEVALADLETRSPEVAAAARALEPGGFCKPIRSRDAFFILKVEAKKEGREAVYEEVREDVKRALQAEKLSLEEKKYLQELKDKAYVKVFQ